MDEAAKRSAAPAAVDIIGPSAGKRARPAWRARFSRLLLVSGARLQNPAVQTPTTEWPGSGARLDRHPAAKRSRRRAGDPSDSWNASTAAARFAALGSTPSGSGGDSPKPGMSTATTSRSAASRSSRRPLDQRAAERMEQEERLAAARADVVEPAARLPPVASDHSPSSYSIKVSAAAPVRS